MTFYAKSIDLSEGDHQKTLEEHEKDILNCADSFFAEYGYCFTGVEKELVRFACNIHDWGKANSIFQKIVTHDSDNSVRQIPHGFLSAISVSRNQIKKIIPELTDDMLEALITAVYHHHTRNDDYTDNDIIEYAKENYLENLKEYLANDGAKPKEIEVENIKLKSSNISKLLFRNNGRNSGFMASEKWNIYLLIKGLLNKFDYSVSAGYINSEISPDIKDKKLCKSIEDKIGSKNLREAQKFMKSHCGQNLIITAPTGSGKTEAALLWLNGEKGFYTLPLKVSSNAIYSRVKDGYDFKDTALLHSDAIQKYMEECGDEIQGIYERNERARLLSYPLTVCTIDQLFKFVYRALGTEILAATLKYSKLIIDEIQAYEPRVLASIIIGLKTIHEIGGRFAVITATFPPILKDFMKEYGLTDGEDYVFSDFAAKSEAIRHNVEMRQKNDMDFDEIAIAGETKKVLVICNTVSRAQDIYFKLQEKSENVYLLHARYIRQDRNMLEKMIMDFSAASDMTGIWVTTQIVEASLDIDFDILYTEMCTADSLLQRMGRCNRRERYFPKEPNIIVYDAKDENGKVFVYDKDIYDRSMLYLEKYTLKPFTEAEKKDYIDKVYNTNEIKDSRYYKEIEKCLKILKEIYPAEYSKKEADEAFRKIQSITVMPDNIYDANIKVIEEVENNYKIDERLKEKIRDLTVSLNCYYGKYPPNVDRKPISEKSILNEIHRTSLKYEFDTEKGKGRGLLLNEIENEVMIF